MPNLEVDRFHLPEGKGIKGIPHTPGTREYLACERGTLVVTAGGRQWRLEAGDVVAFRGDQKHSYANPGDVEAVAYSVVAIAPGPG